MKKIISEKECEVLVNNAVKDVPDKCKIPIWFYWKQIQPIVCAVVAIISVVLGTKTIKYYKSDIISFFGISDMNAYWKAIIGVLFFIIIIAVILFIVPIHELIHGLCYEAYKYQWSFVFSRNLTVSVMSINWRRKLHELIAIISPFVVIQIIAFILYCSVDNIIVFLWLTLINFALSSSDLFAFVMIFVKTPKNAIILGHYFRRQQ